MDFRVKKDAKELFKFIEKDMVAFGDEATNFDIFYFCFIAGVTTMRKGDESNTNQLIDYFPGIYRGDRSKLLIAIFLVYQLKYLGITMDEKKTVRDNISKLIAPDAPNSLSEKGVREFNKFAHGGCEVLIEWFSEDKPRSLQAFLRRFNEKIKEANRSNEQM